MTRDEIIALNPMLSVAQGYGMAFKKIGGEWYSVCPFHPDKSPSFRVNEDKNTWFCDPCAAGGSAIDFVMRKEGLDVKAAMERLGGPKSNGTQPVEVAHYDYKDEEGKLLYQVVRFVPKTFRQRHKGPTGEWVWNMNNVRRVLYRLPEILPAAEVFVVEGEKDADNLFKLGFPATCNVGGAKKWLDSYSQSLKGKVVVVCPDKDTAGQEHAEMVIKSLAGHAKTVFRIDLPEDKDISDFIGRMGEGAKDAILSLVDDAKPVNLAPDLPVLSMAELEEQYANFVKRVETCSLSFGRWLPQLGAYVRKIVPGELVVVMADTGQGKTAILQNIAYHARLPTLIFELELPGTLLFERFVQLETEKYGRDIEDAYKEGTPPNWRLFNRLNHIYVCPKSRLMPDEMEKIINMAELKMGQRPALVCVDYVGLVAGVGTSRYERVSFVAESMKVMAKATDTVVVLASQISRKTEDGEVYLHDAKDSGSIENSAGLVLGAWREGEGGPIMKIKILKNTKGPSGRIVECDYAGEIMRITQRPMNL